MRTRGLRTARSTGICAAGVTVAGIPAAGTTADGGPAPDDSTYMAGGTALLWNSDPPQAVKPRDRVEAAVIRLFVKPFTSPPRHRGSWAHRAAATGSVSGCATSRENPVLPVGSLAGAVRTPA